MEHNERVAPSVGNAALNEPPVTAEMHAMNDDAPHAAVAESQPAIRCVTEEYECCTSSIDCFPRFDAYDGDMPVGTESPSDEPRSGRARVMHFSLGHDAASDPSYEGHGIRSRFAPGSAPLQESTSLSNGTAETSTAFGHGDDNHSRTGSGTSKHPLFLTYLDPTTESIFLSTYLTHRSVPIAYTMAATTAAVIAVATTNVPSDVDASHTYYVIYTTLYLVSILLYVAAGIGLLWLSRTYTAMMVRQTTEEVTTTTTTTSTSAPPLASDTLPPFEKCITRKDIQENAKMTERTMILVFVANMFFTNAVYRGTAICYNTSDTSAASQVTAWCTAAIRPEGLFVLILVITQAMLCVRIPVFLLLTSLTVVLLFGLRFIPGSPHIDKDETFGVNGVIIGIQTLITVTTLWLRERSKRAVFELTMRRHFSAAELSVLRQQVSGAVSAVMPLVVVREGATKDLDGLWGWNEQSVVCSVRVAGFVVWSARRSALDSYELWQSLIQSFDTAREYFAQPRPFPYHSTAAAGGALGDEYLLVDHRADADVPGAAAAATNEMLKFALLAVCRGSDVIQQHEMMIRQGLANTMLVPAHEVEGVQVPLQVRAAVDVGSSVGQLLRLSRRLVAVGPAIDFSRHMHTVPIPCLAYPPLSLSPALGYSQRVAQLTGMQMHAHPVMMESTYRGTVQVDQSFAMQQQDVLLSRVVTFFCCCGGDALKVVDKVKHSEDPMYPSSSGGATASSARGRSGGVSDTTLSTLQPSPRSGIANSNTTITSTSSSGVRVENPFALDNQKEEPSQVDRIRRRIREASTDVELCGLDEVAALVQVVHGQEPRDSEGVSPIAISHHRNPLELLPLCCDEDVADEDETKVRTTSDANETHSSILSTELVFSFPYGFRFSESHTESNYQRHCSSSSPKRDRSSSEMKWLTAAMSLAAVMLIAVCGVHHRVGMSVSDPLPWAMATLAIGLVTSFVVALCVQGERSSDIVEEEEEGNEREDCGLREENYLSFSIIVNRVMSYVSTWVYCAFFMTCVLINNAHMQWLYVLFGVLLLRPQWHGPHVMWLQHGAVSTAFFVHAAIAEDVTPAAQVLDLCIYGAHFVYTYVLCVMMDYHARVAFVHQRLARDVERALERDYVTLEEALEIMTPEGLPAVLIDRWRRRSSQTSPRNDVNNRPALPFFWPQQQSSPRHRQHTTLTTGVHTAILAVVQLHVVLDREDADKALPVRQVCRRLQLGQEIIQECLEDDFPDLYVVSGSDRTVLIAARGQQTRQQRRSHDRCAESDHAHSMARFALQLVKAVSAMCAVSKPSLAVSVLITTGPVLGGLYGKEFPVFQYHGSCLAQAELLLPHVPLQSVIVTERAFRMMEQRMRHDTEEEGPLSSNHMQWSDCTLWRVQGAGKVSVRTIVALR